MAMLLAIAVAANEPFYTAHAARERKQQASVDRRPLNDMVLLVTDVVRKLDAAVHHNTSCTKVAWGDGSSWIMPEFDALRRHLEWQAALRAELERLGYRVERILDHVIATTCSWHMACYEGPYIELCWD